MSNVKIVLEDIEDIIKLRKKLKGDKSAHLPPKEEKEKINIFFDFSKKI